MSLAQIETVIQNFVSDKHNDLLVIKGGWGVGKTYFWQKLIKEAQEKKLVSKDWYAYVTLFGVNDLEELKTSILVEVQNGQPDSAVDKILQITSNAKKAAIALETLPSLQKYTGGLVKRLVFMDVRNSLICIDDIERRGDKLSIKDVMGLASFLKEQRNCKIVLILNEDGLQVKEADDFRRHSEKIIDIELYFSPTSEEAYSYAFPKEYPYYEFIRDKCSRLNIRNIRILQRVKRFIDGLLPLINGLEMAAIEEVLSSIILYVWCFYDKDNEIPPLSFIKSQTSLYFILHKKDEDPKNKIWVEKLISYGYSHTDDVDRILMSLVEKGYVDSDAFSSELMNKNYIARVKQSEYAHSNAWKLLHDSFDDNEEEFVQALLSTFRSNLNNLNLSYLQGDINILRDLGRDEIIDDLINEYFDVHEGNIRAMDRNFYPYMDIVKDQRVIDRMHQIWNSVGDKETLEEALQKIVLRKGGWEIEEAEVLRKSKAEDFYKLFKSVKSDTLNYYIRASLEFEQFERSKKEQGEPFTSVTEALRKIASESRINAVRISSRYGIKTDADPAQPPE
jgi:hypothetical protein